MAIPPGVPAARLYAVVKSICAVPASEPTPMKNAPVIVPGGNPVIESAGLIPTSPVTWVGPILLTTGVAPRIPKEQAVPKGIPPDDEHVAVVNVHTKLAAR
jgi:hypothetical protein